MMFNKNQVKIAITLCIVAALSASTLALVDTATKDSILEAEREFLHKTLKQVLPKHFNDPLKDAFTLEISKGQEVQVFPAKDKQGDVVAYAWEQIAPDGYSGTIRILMGVRVSGEIVGIRITKHQETPGLGDGIVKSMKWLNTFVDQTLKSIRWKVKKDGGDFDQFTGATITPRAVVKAVHKGLKMYRKNQVKLLKLAYLSLKKGGQK